MVRQCLWTESVLALVSLHTVPHNTRWSSGRKELAAVEWQIIGIHLPSWEWAQDGQVTAPGCPISWALPFLLTLGLPLKKSPVGNFGCQALCVSVEGVMFSCTQTMAGWKQAGSWPWTAGFESFSTQTLFTLSSKEKKKSYKEKTNLHRSTDLVTVGTSETSALWPGVAGTTSPQMGQEWQKP